MLGFAVYVQCNRVPLMRQRQGGDWCVACSTFAPSSPEQQKQQQEQQQQQQQQQQQKGQQQKEEDETDDSSSEKSPKVEPATGTTHL